MTHCTNVTRGLLSLVVAGGLVVGTMSTASATQDKCQAKLESLSLGYFNSLSKALAKCKNGIAKGQAKGDNLSKAADGCEKALKAIYGRTFTGDPKPVAPEKTKIGKFLASVNKLSDKGTCTEADLTALGHLNTGVSAPGGTRGPNCTDGATACTEDADCPAGSSCPGSIEWLKTWLLKAKEKLAWKEEVFVVGNARQLLDAAISLQPGPVACADGKTDCGTWCNQPLAASAGFKDRPNLCALNPNVWPPCHDHACALSGGAGAVLNPVGAPISLSGRRLALQTCRLPVTNGVNPVQLPVEGGHCECDLGVSSGACTQDAPCQFSGVTPCGAAATGLPGTCYPDWLVLINEPSRTFQPPPSIPIVPAITVCIETIRSEGWCDCRTDAASAQTNPAFCLDHVTNNEGTCAGAPNGVCTFDSDCFDNLKCKAAGTPVACCTGKKTGTCPGAAPCNFPGTGTCPETGPSLESNCVCGAPAGPDCQAAGCLACVNSGTGARCHAGTANSDVTQTFSGASVEGSCVDLNTIQFRLEPPAICINAMGAAAGQCTAPGPPDPGCAMNGGVVCLASDGGDNVFCTADDLVPASAPTSVPFTTESSTSTIEDFVAVEGSCAGGTTPGKNCASDGDCPGGTCAGATYGCGTGPNPEDCQYTAGPGVRVGCPNLESSNLATWSIVGSFPALDGASVNDNVITFTLACS